MNLANTHSNTNIKKQNKMTSCPTDKKTNIPNVKSNKEKCNKKQADIISENTSQSQSSFFCNKYEEKLMGYNFNQQNIKSEQYTHSDSEEFFESEDEEDYYTEEEIDNDYYNPNEYTYAYM